jgi:hypothetical protein
LVKVGRRCTEKTYFVAYSSKMSIFSFDSTSSREDLQKLLDVSNEIFQISPSDSPLVAPADINQWIKRLQQNGGKATLYKDSSNDDIAAFVFTYHRSKDLTQLHIWIAGCRDTYRRKGIMAQIFSHVEKDAYGSGVQVLTVNTYPVRFPNMPLFLASQGYSVVKQIFEQDERGQTVEKLSLEKRLL